jgi:hypothetical protein
MGAGVLHAGLMRALEARLRRLEAKHRPEGRVFCLAWGRTEEEASERVSLARAAGEVGPGDVVVMARWTDRHMPASRWVGSIGPSSAELDALLGGIRCAMDGVDDRVGEDADPDPRVAAPGQLERCAACRHGARGGAEVRVRRSVEGSSW